ncbi:XdhC family protein [Marinobacter sp.]|uniref:XdhC family protein n=1 Tax=Marinobacter sp. TaxID=50741 RepID=UPI003564F203
MSDLPVAQSVVTGRQAVLDTLSDWLGLGQRAWLCTIVETWGSSPRPVGSWLAISESGHWSGSVSGGCLEEDLLRRTAENGAGHPVFVDYGITDDDRDQFQLPCGGRIRLLVEPLVGDAGLDHVRALADALERRQPVVRRVPLKGTATLDYSVSRERNPVRFDGEQLLHGLQPECRLLLIGAGEVARYVWEFATAADFAVTLCEPREIFAAGWSYDQIPLDRRLPDDLIATEFGDTWSGILALAHDPRIDDMGLLAALHSRAFYIGAMGSRKTSEARRERLASLGLEKAALDRLRAPIGVDIPSKTPAEIAISIVADLIAARHHLRGAASSL